jgi:hypothetical protein
MNKICPLAFLSACAVLTSNAQTYDVAADFSANNNPNGTWSYGYSLTLGGQLNLYTNTVDVCGLNLWLFNIAGYTPSVHHNPTTNVIICAVSERIGPSGFGLHPGPDDEYSVARFTVPSPGPYRVTGSFFGEDSFPTSTDIHILTNGVSLLDGEVTGFGPGSGPAFDLEVTVNTGDQLDFAVGYGTNGGYGYDLTGLTAQIITLTPAPSVLADSFTIVAETCTNNAIDPGERVTVSIGLQNVGTANTTNLVATLQTGGGVSAPTGPQTYGVLVTNGAAVARSFTFTGSGACGSNNTAALQLQDGAASLGTVTFIFSLGQTSITTNFYEDFDSLTPPDIPQDWATLSSSVELIWVTTTAASDTPPNSAFVPDVPDVGLSELDSPVITLPAGPSQLSFRKYYNLEWSGAVGYDGGVLEININGGGWSDILDAGGSFSSGGYIAPISTFYSNPLAGRSAWTGNSGGFITTAVDLPDAAAGQSIQLRWLCGTDNSVNWLGWYLDTIAITTTMPVCCTPPPVFTSATLNGSTLTLSWSAIPGRSYQILYCTDLVQLNWTALATVLATEFGASITDTVIASPRRFYRAALLP